MSMIINESSLLANYQNVMDSSQLDSKLTDDKLLQNITENFSSSTLYESFRDGLLTDLFESGQQNASIKKNLERILDRQKQVMITESSTVMSSPEAMAFSVASFPMLVDLYAEPVLAKAVTVYPYDKPALTIPRIKWIATIVDIYGDSKDYEYPTATKAIRQNIKTVKMSPSDNVFKQLSTGGNTILADDFRISKRNARLTKIYYKVDGGVEQAAEIFGIFDAKGNFFVDDLEVDGVDGLFRIQGQIVFGNGKFTYGVTDVTPDGAASAQVDIVGMDCQFKITGNGIGKGVVKSKPLMSTIEVDCDIEESYEITEIEEILQDWKALWKLDTLSVIKDHIKEQMKLNKDAEIADLLYGNIAAAKKYKLYREFDASKGKADAGEYRPTNVMDVFKNIYPLFIDLVDQMRKRIKMEPKFILCGTKAGSILKSLQDFEISMMNGEGQIGQVKGNPQINKFEIIVSDAIENDLIHLVTKSEEFRLATILEVTYKPLYVIVETTNSKRRTFIKSRGWIGIVRNEGIATIKVLEFEDLFGNV